MVKYDSDDIKAKAKKVKLKYKEELPLPNTSVPVTDKDTPAYAKKWAERIYSLFQLKKTWVSSDEHDDIVTLRKYAAADQPTEQYKQFILGSSSKPKANAAIDGDGYDARDGNTPENTRKAWVNLDFKPVSVGPKLLTKINEQIAGFYYEVNLDAIDSLSTELEEFAKYRLWFEKENASWLKSQYALMGIKQQEPEFIPENINELELYASNGGFKVPYATSMESLLKHTFDISGWNKEVQERIIRDLCAGGVAIAREYYDDEEKRLKVKYVDPEYGGVQYNRHNSFKDSEYGYELEFWEISKVMQKFSLSREQAAALAYAYSGHRGNPSAESWGEYGIYNEETSALGFGFYKIPVFRCEWVDIDNEKHVEHITKAGRKIVSDYTEGSGKEFVSTPVRYTREATWVPGTDHLCSFGKVAYIPRPNPKKPRVSYRAVKLLSPSIFSQARPLLDGLQNAWLRAQQSIAIAVSNGLAIDVGAIKNISIGKDKSWDALEVLRYYRQNSILLYSQKNPMGVVGGVGGNGIPVTPLITRMFENIKVNFDIMDKFMQQVETFTGLNMVSTGDTPEPGLGKFNMQVALAGSNQVINSIARGLTSLQEDLGENLVYRLRLLIQNNKDIEQSYTPVIGKSRMKAVLIAEKSNVEYGLKVTARDVSELKAFIDNILVASIKSPNPEGEGKLDISEALIIKNMIDEKQNIQRIALYIGNILRRKNRAAQQSQLQRIEAQGRQLAGIEQMKEQGKVKDRAFEMAKMQKEFENEYFLQHGTPPRAAPAV